MPKRIAPADVQLAALSLVGLFCAFKLPVDLYIITPLDRLQAMSLSRTPDRSYCEQFQGNAREICAQACAC